MNDILLFIIIQLINVVLSTIKSIITVNGQRKTASIISAVSYTFGAIVVKMLATQSFEIAILVTFFTNLFGVYIGKWIVDLKKPVKQWIVNTTLRSNKLGVERALKNRNIKYTLIEAENDRWLCVIYSFTKAESALVKEILLAHNAPYSITESREATAL